MHLRKHRSGLVYEIPGREASTFRYLPALSARNSTSKSCSLPTELYGQILKNVGLKDRKGMHRGDSASRARIDASVLQH